VLPKPILTIALLACVSLTAFPAAADIWNTVGRPLPPTALTVERSEAGNMLSWDPPLANPGAPIDAYNVYRYVDTQRESLGSVGSASTSFVDGDVDPGNHTYVYFVTAASSTGESVPSNLATPSCNNLITSEYPYVNPECLPGGGQVILRP
jgi:hypothetical protein